MGHGDQNYHQRHLIKSFPLKSVASEKLPPAVGCMEYGNPRPDIIQ